MGKLCAGTSAWRSSGERCSRAVTARTQPEEPFSVLAEPWHRPVSGRNWELCLLPSVTSGTSPKSWWLCFLVSASLPEE